MSTPPCPHRAARGARPASRLAGRLPRGGCHGPSGRRGVIGALGLVGVAVAVTTAQPGPPPASPRIVPLVPAALTDAGRRGIETFGVEPEAATHLLLTLARHPPALHGLGPLASYLRRRSMVTAVDQVLIGLRAAWLSGAEAIWAELAAEARQLGLGDADFRRVALGPDAEWGRWDATILQVADEIYRDSFIGDASWAQLAARYDAQQLLDVVFTGAESIMLSMMANSYGVEPDARFPDRWPPAVERPVVRPRAAPGRLSGARLTPLPRDAWTDEVRALLDPDGRGGDVLNLYATLARHPALYRPRAVQSAYIRTGATLSDRAREILILRIGWLCGSEYEWAQHVRAARRIGMSDDEIRRLTAGADADGWDPVEAALVRATDELHRDATITDATWAALAARYDTPELIDVVITVAGYRMVSIALNTLGTPLEPGRAGFPAGRRP